MTAARGSRGKPAGLTIEQEATWFAYMRVVLRLNYEINRQLQQENDLSLQDFHVLNALADSPGGRLQLTHLGIRIGWELSRVSHQLRRMERRGLIVRERSHNDRRATDAVLTAAGRAALRGATPSHAALVKHLFFDGLPPDRLPELKKDLEAIYQQVLAQGSLPRPDSRQDRWADPSS